MKHTKPLFLLISFFVVVFMGCKKDGSIASKMDDKGVVSHTYETDDTHFYDGEILLPDYAHGDTLVVISSKFLNWAMEYYDAGNDGDISDILGEGTIPIADYADYIEVMSQTECKILKEATDSRGLTSVVFSTPDNDTLALDYLTKYEYDSLFKQ